MLWPAFVFSLMVGLFACQREEVVKQAVLDLQAHDPIICFPDTTCCAAETVFLTETNGNQIVNFCNQGNAQVPCAPGQPNWGFVEIYKHHQDPLTFPNSTLSMEYNVSLAPGWYASSYDSYLGIPGSLPLNGNQPPVIGPGWVSASINSNRFNIHYPLSLGQLGPAVYEFAIKVTVRKLNLFGAAVPGSARVLWGNTSGFDYHPYVGQFSCGGCPMPVKKVVTPDQCTFCRARVSATFLGCERVNISSCQPIKQVVIVYNDCSRQYYDNLSALSVSYTGIVGKSISHVWVRSGCRGNSAPANQDLIDTNGFSYPNIRRFRIEGFCTNPACN